MADPAFETSTDLSCHRVIASLNDALRQAPSRSGHNHVVLTTGIMVLIGDVREFRGFQRRAEILRAVRDFDSFPPGGDPYGEHDFGALDYDGTRIFWKIDYYDRTMMAGSPSPADPGLTVRVLTIMCADEY